MDFKETFKNLKEKLFSLIGKIKDDCRENPRKAIIILLSLVIILLIIILICVIAKSPEKKEEKGPEIVFTEELMVPDELTKEYDYDISRTTEPQWSEENSEVWFTIPTPDQIEQLGNENENMISDVIGAAP